MSVSMEDDLLKTVICFIRRKNLVEAVLPWVSDRVNRREVHRSEGAAPYPWSY